MDKRQLLTLPCVECKKNIFFRVSKFSVNVIAEQSDDDTSVFPALEPIHEALVDDVVNKNLSASLQHKLLIQRADEVRSCSIEEILLEGNSLPKIRCPHCGMDQNAVVQIVPIAFIKTQEIAQISNNKGILDPAVVYSGGNTLSLGAQKLIKELMEAGIFKGFEEAFLIQNEGQPKDPYRKFLKFLESTKKGWPRNDLFGQLKNTFPDSSIEFWSGEGIGVILINGAIYRFMPMRFTLQPVHKTLAGDLGTLSIKKREKSEELEREIDFWRKGKGGYVPFDTPIFLSELRKKCAGSFETTGNP